MESRWWGRSRQQQLRFFLNHDPTAPVQFATVDFSLFVCSFLLDKVSVGPGERTAWSTVPNDGKNPIGITLNTTALRCQGLSADESGAGELIG